MIEGLIKVAVFATFCGVLMAFLDRYRGSTADNSAMKWLKRAVYAAGATVLTASPQDAWWALAFFVIFLAGSVPGWGLVLGEAMGGAGMGKEPASWQKGVLATNLELALVVRGAMWLGPAVLLYIPTGNVVYIVAPLVMLGAFVISPFIAARFPAGPGARWEPLELARGGIYGFFVGGFRAALEIL